MYVPTGGIMRGEVHVAFVLREKVLGAVVTPGEILGMCGRECPWDAEGKEWTHTGMECSSY